jgi:hypothetical protein
MTHERLTHPRDVTAYKTTTARVIVVEHGCIAPAPLTSHGRPQMTHPNDTGLTSSKQEAAKGHPCQARAHREQQLRLPILLPRPGPPPPPRLPDHPSRILVVEEGFAPCHHCRATSPNVAALTSCCKSHLLMSTGHREAKIIHRG